MSTPDDTAVLLHRWYGGDEQALLALLDRHLDAVSEGAHGLLGRFPFLRSENDTVDLVQDAVMKVLRYGPRFIPRNGTQFEALLVRFVRNRLYNQARSPRWREGQRHSAEAASLLDLRAASGSTHDPLRAAEKAEERDWARFAIEFLSDEDRLLFQLRLVDGLSWLDVAEALGLGEDSARMRFERLKPKLVNLVRRAREGQVDELLASPLN